MPAARILPARVCGPTGVTIREQENPVRDPDGADVLRNCLDIGRAGFRRF
jgi:hypothetical protein